MKQASAPLIELLTYGKEPKDLILEPRIDDTGAFVLEPEESVLYSGFHKVSMSIWNASAGLRGNKEQWESVAKPERKAGVYFTNQRLLLAWPKWKSDRTSGSLLERRVMAAAMERSEGRMLLGAHVRHPWVTSVFVSKPEGSFSKRRRLRISFQAEANEFTLVVYGLAPDTGEQLGRSFSAAMAEQRLAAHAQLTEEQRHALHDLARSQATPVDVGWADQYQIPAGKKVGYVFGNEDAFNEIKNVRRR